MRRFDYYDVGSAILIIGCIIIVLAFIGFGLRIAFKSEAKEREQVVICEGHHGVYKNSICYLTDSTIVPARLMQ